MFPLSLFFITYAEGFTGWPRIVPDLARFWQPHSHITPWIPLSPALPWRLHADSLCFPLSLPSYIQIARLRILSLQRCLPLSAFARGTWISHSRLRSALGSFRQLATFEPTLASLQCAVRVPLSFSPSTPSSLHLSHRSLK